jgi:hypothetical protein
VRGARHLVAEGITPGRPGNYGEVGSQATHTKSQRRRGPLIPYSESEVGQWERYGTPSFCFTNERLIVKWDRFVIFSGLPCTHAGEITACTAQSAET